MSKEETPISKYLASLERRQAFMTPSPTPDPNAIIRKINFEDDTFFQPDQSVIRISPSPEASRPSAKRKRLSILGESWEGEENQNKKLNDLERLLQQTQGELIDARATNTKLEYQMSQNKRSHEERILGFQTAHNEMKTKMREATDHAETWKEQLNKVTRKEEDLREKLHQQTETHSEKINTIEKKLRALETENLELKGKFECGTVRQSDELRKLSANLEQTEMGAEKWIMETQMLRDQLELKEKQLLKYQNELKEAQSIICKYNELRGRYDDAKSPDGTSGNLEEKIKYFENIYVKQQTENLRLIQKMETISDENRMLRSTMNKEMLLEEQISTFEDEVRTLRSTIDTKAAVEAENGTLRMELSAWKTMAFKLDPDCTSYLKFESYIRKIQNQLLEAKHEGSTYKLTIADRDRTVAKAQAEKTALQEQVKNLSTEKENLTQELKKASRRLLLVTKDRDGLKELKESYEQEFEGVISKPLQERINQLEATVAEYEAMIQEDPSSKKACGECEKRIALISDIRAEMDRLKREKAEVESQIANMSVAGSSSTEDGNTTGIKIVSFGLNPSAMSLEARLKEAIKEIEELKEKLKESQDQTVAGSSKGSDGNLLELEDKNKTLERKLEILSEAYDFETQQLQLIVNKLCGFHFTLVREPSVQIRLSSVYSSQNDVFIFQESPNGDMLLLESPILDNFREDIDRFLLREGSIPGFLSSVTITYVQSQSNQDASQLPASQQSTVEDDEASTASATIRDPREIQVEVQRQRHPTTGNDESDEEEEEGNDDDDEESEGEDENDGVDDEDDEEGAEEEHDGDEMDEEDEQYEDDREEDYGEESEEEENLPPQPRSRPPPPPQSRQPAGDDSDSDVIMIDSD